MSKTRNPSPDGPKDGLASALDAFFSELQGKAYREDFEASYQRLQQEFSLNHELLRSALMERFLQGIHELLSVKPDFADAKLLHGVLQDIGLERDAYLYQSYEATICSLRDLVRLQRQKELWLHRIDANAARILLDPELNAGFHERRQARLLARISEAIRLMHEDFPLLPGRLVTHAKIQLWQEQSGIITHEQLIRACLGFFYIPVLAAVGQGSSMMPVYNETTVLLSYPLGLIYEILAPKLRRTLKQARDRRTLQDRRFRSMSVLFKRRPAMPGLSLFMALAILWILASALQAM